MKIIHLLFAQGMLAGLTFLQPEQIARAEPTRPNVIIILADDLGYGDIGCYGALPEHIRTPAMDRLASQGLRFTDAHAPSSVCTPSRYSLLTGEDAFRDQLADGIIAGDAPLSITPGTFTLPALFKTNGYATAFVGKWHLGLAQGGDRIDWNGEIKPGPVEIGFDHAFYMPSTGDRVPTVLIRDHRVENLDPADPIRVSYGQKIGNEPTGKDDPEAATGLLGANNEGHQGTITKGVSRIGWMTGGQAARWTDAELMNRLNAEALRFIRDHRSKPFFLYFATQDIHEPRAPATNYVGRSGCGVYGDQILELDHAVSLVLQTLDDLKLADHTLVILSSDNGGSLRDMKAYQYGTRADLHGHRINGVLRGGKYSVWEGGTRVPLIVSWPGHVPAGGVSPALVSLTDLEASLARLLGVKLPEKAASDSVDVLAALLGKSLVGRNELLEHQSGKAGALREGNWKYTDGRLYDLSRDLSETNNLATEQPGRTKAMAARLKELGATEPAPPNLSRVTRMAWWRAARFGMFIHYGPVSLTGKELSWSRANSNTNCPNHGPTPVAVYDNLYRHFNPTNFNASDWTGLAKSAGMKYLIFVAKHGDGFLMWHSKVDPYNIGASPFRRDFCAELAQAARKAGLGFGFYFSPMDWRDPECRSASNAHFVAHLQDELRELLTDYGKVDVLWFDSDGRPTRWSPETTYPLVRGLQPQIIIDNRLQLDTGEEWAHQEKLKLRANEDFYTPEQKVGAYDDQQPWESCMTLGTQWSWKPNDKIKSAAEVVGILAQTVGGDGNLLLDVGPMPDGRIEPRQAEVLQKVGAWMQVNAESIYGTRGGPWKPTRQIASTRKGNTVCVFVLDRSQTTVELPALPRKIIAASVLGGGSVSIERTGNTIVLHLPPRQAGTATVVQLELDGSAMDIPSIALP